MITSERTGVLVLVFLVILTVLVAVHWQQRLEQYYHVDFAAYWSAGRALNEGVYRYSYFSQDDEGVFFRHAMFLNPPIVAQPFRLIGWWSYGVAKEIWFGFQLVMFVAAVLLLARNARERVLTLALTIIGMPLFFWPLFAELERGETNLLLLAAVVASYWLWRRGYMIAAGVVLGLGSAFKFPLLLVWAVPLALRQWKFLAAAAAAFMVVYIGSLVIDGVDINREYFVNYLPGIAAKDHLPDAVFSVKDTPKPPTTRWEGVTYITRYPFHALCHTFLSFPIRQPTGPQFGNRRSGSDWVGSAVQCLPTAYLVETGSGKGVLGESGLGVGRRGDVGVAHSLMDYQLRPDNISDPLIVAVCD